jgi:pantetheine-phosphate adenylyltransferase
MMQAKARKLRYKSVALGGTFDVFHSGHRQLLSHAFGLGERVLIGITSDQLVKTLGKAHPVQNYASRAREVRRFLKQRGWTHRGETRPLTDRFGPAASRKSLQAIVVTPKTLPSARKLNRERRKRGLTSLEIQTIPLANAKDGIPISSTRIRNGEIDRQGKILRKSPRSLPRKSGVTKRQKD